MLEDLLPIWRIIIATQVRFQLASQYLQRGALANPIGSNKTQDLPWTWGRQSVDLEAIRGVSLGDLCLQIRGQVDDVDRAEWTLFGADTTSNAQSLRYEGDPRFWGDFDAELARSDDRTRFLALLATFLRKSVL